MRGAPGEWGECTQQLEKKGLRATEDENEPDLLWSCRPSGMGHRAACWPQPGFVWSPPTPKEEQRKDVTRLLFQGYAKAVGIFNSASQRTAGRGKRLGTWVPIWHMRFRVFTGHEDTCRGDAFKTSYVGPLRLSGERWENAREKGKGNSLRLLGMAACVNVSYSSQYLPPKCPLTNNLFPWFLPVFRVNIK